METVNKVFILRDIELPPSTNKFLTAYNKNDKCKIKYEYYQIIQMEILK